MTGNAPLAAGAGSVVVLPVAAQQRIAPGGYRSNFRRRHRKPIRKAVFFLSAEGPAAVLRKVRSKLKERRIEAAQALVVARLEPSVAAGAFTKFQAGSRSAGRSPGSVTVHSSGGDDWPGQRVAPPALIGLTRDLGGPLRFHPELVFRVRPGALEATRPERSVVLSQRARELMEAYLPVPACPLAPLLAEAVLAENGWLSRADPDGVVSWSEPVDPAEKPPVRHTRSAPSAASRVRRPASAAGRRSGVYLVGVGGYAREEILPRLRGRVVAGVDHKAAFIERYAPSPFPVYDSMDPLLDAIAADPSPLVIVASYHSDHVPTAARVLDANARARVFVEKPPVVDSAEASDLVARREAGARIEIGYNRRYAPLTARLKDALSGRPKPWRLLMRVHEVKIPSSHWYLWPNQGTRITGNLCHWIDLSWHLVREAVDELNVAGPESDVRVTLRFADGSVAAIHASDDGDATQGVHERIHVTAGAGSLVLDDYRYLEEHDTGARRRRAGTGRRDRGHATMFRGLLSRWERDLPPDYPTADIVPVASLVEAAARRVAGQPLEPGRT